MLVVCFVLPVSGGVSSSLGGKLTCAARRGQHCRSFLLHAEARALGDALLEGHCVRGLPRVCALSFCRHLNDARHMLTHLCIPLGLFFPSSCLCVGPLPPAAARPAPCLRAAQRVVEGRGQCCVIEGDGCAMRKQTHTTLSSLYPRLCCV
ncbi:hypothetical protein JB92DRAFT_518203, partial [Gautieria morchelliformis]